MSKEVHFLLSTGLSCVYGQNPSKNGLELIEAIIVSGLSTPDKRSSFETPSATCSPEKQAEHSQYLNG